MMSTQQAPLASGVNPFTRCILGFALTFLAIYSTPSRAIYKCLDKTTATQYQDHPCAEKETAQTVLPAITPVSSQEEAAAKTRLMQQKQQIKQLSQQRHQSEQTAQADQKQIERINAATLKHLHQCEVLENQLRNAQKALNKTTLKQIGQAEERVRLSKEKLHLSGC